MGDGNAMNDTDRRNATAKLPKWAQQEIEQLQRTLAEARRKIAELSDGPQGSDTYVHEYGIHPDRPLGLHAEVRFDLGESGKERGDRPVVICRTGEVDAEPVLEVRIGGGYPHITPKSANTFRIRVGRY